MRRFARDIAGDSRGLLALLGVLLLLLLGDSVLHEEPLAELGYAITLLSVFGAAVYSGHLVKTLLKSGAGFSALYPLLPAPSPSSSGRGEIIGDIPVPVMMLLSSFSFLFAGLAGWVDGDFQRA